MSLAVPFADFTRWESNETSPSSPIGTSVTAGGSAHTKNTTYTQLIASTAFDACAVLVMFSDVGATNTNTATLVDIAIGAAASETVIIPNLNAGFAALSTAGLPSGQRYYFPLYIPAGSRLSATSQAAVVSDTVNVVVKLYGEPSRPVWAGSQVVDYGTAAGSSKGVTVATGTSGGEGNWTQIVASTTQDHSFFSVGVAGDGDASQTSGSLFVDLGVGSATEAAIAENTHLNMSSTESLTQSFPMFAWHQVPSGTRLAARISHVSATAQNYDVIAYGVS